MTIEGGKRPADLNPCPFCGDAGEWGDRAQTYWTGMRSAPLSHSILHWCEKIPGVLHCFMEVRGKTRDEAVAQWNTRVSR